MHPSATPPVGGALCLDFCNTVRGPGTARAEEWFADEAGLAAWCAASGLAPPRRPTLPAALALRGAIGRAFAARAAARPPAAADLAAVWHAYRGAVAGATLIAEGDIARIALPGDDPLAAVACSAVALLCEPGLPLKLCGAPDCGRLFLDYTKNGGRLFCNLRCGNRTRARGHYNRKKASAQA
jgi:predicted RNA-binding Zn ribbon-like protein